MPRVRMGMHTGWARPIGDEYASIEVHRAARVAAAAHGGQILCSGATALAVLTENVPVPFGGHEEVARRRADAARIELRLQGAEGLERRRLRSRGHAAREALQLLLQ